jgi:hypothetical protein
MVAGGITSPDSGSVILLHAWMMMRLKLTTTASPNRL